jgi:hypothetical protein
MSHVPGRRDHDWPDVPLVPAYSAESVPAVPRSPSKVQSGQVPALSEDGTSSIVSLDGTTTGSDKLKAVREWPTPKNRHEIRRFLDLCTYYRRFTSGFANVAKTLTKLTEEKEAFQWTPELEVAFQTLKEALSTAPILAFPSAKRKVCPWHRRE